MADIKSTAKTTYRKAVNTQFKALTAQLEVTGRLAQVRYRSLQNLNPQWASRFEVILYPAPKSTGLLDGTPAQDAAALAKAIMSVDDMNVANLNARSITIPSNKFEYETDGSGKRYLKNVAYAESVTIEFLEDQKGSIRSLMERWIADIGEMDKMHEKFPQKAYLFNEKQDDAKKNARVLLLDDAGKPSGGMFSIFGMRPADIGDVTLAHNSGEPLIMPINFAVDYIEYGSIGDPIGGLVKKVVGTVI